ncbi:hypothetical protein CPAST_c24230 [Clostridium pasteurianum DSM 525 = ATCC 6013]|uniref:Bacteriophage lambda head decoration protein D n=1 Tax=Clostridium pasteurianum DSM 525 = ATCC 6013 TaxID=1262449 RepID=A0A0H3J916_CLOPA|nr:hypothetical protein [Clostridium pasteurianum]AJA48493.1 hypothetical protein CPAST_c24230 [Clostridium pasteurianum DSM 525 = ATCC 6013]AJA52481.1 hypothetical protein CLPA_c24230 [Clostridium pasteurianum DSM 525 = ATCC 6013]AOZ75733.1 hypothetical protein AQ983_11775 [Clostridium pasteurianum DSM 525 = ATCC 6013]AOZ79529.1 hypothetical protein AQ984_11770 [Clostridium pasteurianum]ELP60360.1 hypothetical protein F502_02707 [Clostridium pasteurianum DSM 525 = ATCC 6013]
MSKFIETTYTNKKEILKFPDHYIAIAVTVDDTAITANADGKKIVPAGTIVGGSTKPVLTNTDEPASKKNVQGTDADKAEGVLLDDVDVTFGKASGAMIIHGFIAIDKLPEAPAASAVTALKQITFIK